MTVLDDRLPKIISDLIAKYGRSATFYVDAGTYDPTTDVHTADVTEYTELVTPPEAFSAALIDGSMIERDDLEIGLPAYSLEFTPSNGMRVAIGNQSYRIVRIRRDDTGALVGMYWLQLRA